MTTKTTKSSTAKATTTENAFSQKYCGKVYNSKAEFDEKIQSDFKASVENSGVRARAEFFLEGLPKLYYTSNFAQFRKDAKSDKYPISKVLM